MLPNRVRFTDPSHRAAFKRAERLATFAPAGLLVAALLAAAHLGTASDGPYNADARGAAPSVGAKSPGEAMGTRLQPVPVTPVRPAG